MTREVSLGKPHAGEIRDSREFSPDGLRVAYSVKTVEGEFVMVDSVAGKTYTEIPRYPLTEAGIKSQIVFSPDGKRAAYKVWRDRRRLVVCDGKAGPAYQFVSEPVFSPDSRHIIYKATLSEVREVAVVDGIAGAAFDSVGAYFRFSPDGRRVAYYATHGGKKFVVVDGAEGRTYDDVDDLLFTRDSKHLAYTAQRDGKHFVVVNNVESQEYDQFVRATRRVEEDSPFHVSLLLGGPHGFSVLAARGQELLRVELEVVGQSGGELRGYFRPRPRREGKLFPATAQPLKLHGAHHGSETPLNYGRRQKAHTASELKRRSGMNWLQMNPYVPRSAFRPRAVLALRGWIGLRKPQD